MTVERFTKQPGETRRVDLSFRRHLTEAGDAPMPNDPATATMTGGSARIAAWIHLDSVVTVWVEGGADGERCTGTVTLGTLGGERLELDFVMRIVEK